MVACGIRRSQCKVLIKACDILGWHLTSPVCTFVNFKDLLKSLDSSHKLLGFCY